MLFGKPGAHPTAPDDTIEIAILKHNGELEGFNQWLLNGVVFSMETMKLAYTVKQGLPLPDENSAMPATTFILSISIATASSSCASAVSRPRARSKMW